MDCLPRKSAWSIPYAIEVVLDLVKLLLIILLYRG